jgi:hypothetical protein
MLGQLEKYGNVFDLGKYRKVKNGYVRYILRNRKDPLHKEILEFAKKTAFGFPLAHVLLAYVSCILLPLPLEQRIKRILPNSLKRRIRHQSAKAGFF